MKHFNVFAVLIFYIHDALATGSPGVVLSFVGQILILLLPALYIVFAKVAWAKKAVSLGVCALGGLGFFGISNIPNYYEYSGLIEFLSFSVVIIAGGIAILTLKNQRSLIRRFSGGKI